MLVELYNRNNDLILDGFHVLMDMPSLFHQHLFHLSRHILNRFLLLK